MATVALVHKHFDADHLELVKAQMLELGAPSIRAVWHPTHDVWVALEGCHRLRAAAALGVTPIIVDMTSDLPYDSDEPLGAEFGFDSATLIAELMDDAPRSKLIDFKGLDDV